MQQGMRLLLACLLVSLGTQLYHEYLHHGMRLLQAWLPVSPYKHDMCSCTEACAFW